MIIAEHVSKAFGTFVAVRDLDFTIDDGECVGLLGLNGAGKSTTLRMLACVLEPSAGRIVIDGQDVCGGSAQVRQRVGYVPDRPPLYDEMDVRGYLRFAGRLRGLQGARLNQRVDAAMERCALRAVADATIATLSHGYRQRVGIAQAILHEPTLLILDEPTQGLDPLQIAEMRALIRDLRGAHTVLLSTHQLAEIEATCDRIVLLHEGHVVAQGTEAELSARFGDGGELEVEVRGGEAAIRAALQRLALTELTLERVSGAAASAQGCDHRDNDPRSDPNNDPSNDPCNYAHDRTEGSDAADVWRLRLVTRGDQREQVAATLVGAGIGIRSLRRRKTGLDAAFAGLRSGGAA